MDSETKADHEFYGKLKLIWAHGRSDDSFYKPDEIKYHGGNKGQYTLRKTFLHFQACRESFVPKIKQNMDKVNGHCRKILVHFWQMIHPPFPIEDNNCKHRNLTFLLI